MITEIQTGTYIEAQIELCPICLNPAKSESLSEASWLPLGAVAMLESRHPGWQMSYGACPSCVQSTLLEQLIAQGEVTIEDRIKAALPLSAEAAFGVLPTPMRLHGDSRFRGRGTALALIDIGFYPHPDLVKPDNRIRAWVDASVEPVNALFFGPNETPEWPGWDSAGPAQWHGLMTSGVAAGNGWLSHGLYRGFASEADVVLVQVRGQDGRIGNANIARALRWLHQNGPALGVKVVSISVAGERRDWLAWNAVDKAVSALVEDGITVVAASGNAGKRELVPPATAPDALTVGGIDDRNNFDPEAVDVWHSNYGECVTGLQKPELVAPSIWVVAPVLPGTEVAAEAERLFTLRQIRDLNVELLIADQKFVTPYYQHVEGTSFAAPIVASVIACMLEANPSLTPDKIREILETTAQPVEGADRERQGAGALVPALAVACAARAESGPLEGIPLSPQVNASGVTFWLYEPDATSVRLQGSWDNQSSSPGVEARQERPGIWRARIEGLDAGQYTYRFLVDGVRWVDDPSNPRKVANVRSGFDSAFIL